MAKSKATGRVKAKPFSQTDAKQSVLTVLERLLGLMEKYEVRLERIEKAIEKSNAGTPSQHGRG